MKKILYISFLFLFVTIIGCKSKKGSDDLVYFVKDSTMTKRIVGQKITYPFVTDFMNAFFIINDSVAIVGNEISDRIPYLLEFYNMNTGRMISGFLRAGKGKGEIVSANYRLKNNTLFVLNGNKQELIPVDISLALTDSTYLPTAFETGGAYGDVDFVCGDTIVATNFLYYDFFSSKAKFNKGLPRFYRMSLNKDVSIPWRDWVNFKTSVFLPNVQTECVAVNQSKNRIVTASRTLPEITLFDLAGNRVKTLIGPEVYDIKFSVINNVAMFTRFYASFSSIFGNDNYFYLSYENMIDVSHLDSSKGINSEIFQFDWDGNLLNHYQLDKKIYKFSINGDYLYATTSGEESLIDIYKFKLK